MEEEEEEEEEYGMACGEVVANKAFVGLLLLGRTSGRGRRSHLRGGVSMARLVAAAAAGGE